jgi:trimethylamine-N-oxide reductase (cytochrome c)
MKIQSILYAMAQLMKYRAKTSPAFQKLLQGKNIVLQIKLADNSVGRYFKINNGKVTSKSGIHPQHGC